MVKSSIPTANLSKAIFENLENISRLSQRNATGTAGEQERKLTFFAARSFACRSVFVAYSPLSGHENKPLSPALIIFSRVAANYVSDRSGRGEFKQGQDTQDVGT
jgi:alkyl hydroperoxide reductase subunit AhpF